MNKSMLCVCVCVVCVCVCVCVKLKAPYNSWGNSGSVSDNIESN